MCPEEAEAIFERFHRGRAGRAVPGGSGLGLAIARELAARSGAAISIARRHPHGARATVRFTDHAPTGHPPADRTGGHR